MKRSIILLAILSLIPLAVLAKGGGGGKTDPWFTDQTSYFVGDVTRSVAAADLDGDGDLDLAASYRYYDHIAVMFNDGEGVFGEPVYYPSGEFCTAIWADDLDEDGDADLAVVADYFDTTFNLFILLNNGDGTFAPPVAYETATYSTDVLAADFDGDLDLDLAVTNRGNQSVSILMNQGDGSFGPAVHYYANGCRLDAVFSIDLDDDMDLDVIVSGYHVNDVFILINNGDGSFADPVAYPSGGVWCRSVFSADFDGDGDNDVVTANFASDNLSILRNKGNGTFFPATIVDANDGPRTIFAADLDNDGDPDLAVGNNQTPDGWYFDISIFPNRNGAFRSKIDYQSGLSPAGIIAADLDGDLDAEIIVANSSSGEVEIFFNTTRTSCCMIRGDADGSGQFDIADANFLVQYIYHDGPAPSCMDEADVDDDGDVDQDDIDYILAYLFEGGPAPVPCP